MRVCVKTPSGQGHVPHDDADLGRIDQQLVVEAPVAQALEVLVEYRVAGDRGCGRLGRPEHRVAGDRPEPHPVLDREGLSALELDSAARVVLVAELEQLVVGPIVPSEQDKLGGDRRSMHRDLPAVDDDVD